MKTQERRRVARNRPGQLTASSTAYGREVIVVSLAGELDLANVDIATRALEEAFAEEEAMVVVDLQGLTFLDVKGITLLEELNRREGAWGRLRILPSRSLGVTRVLRTVGLDSMVKIVRD